MKELPPLSQRLDDMEPEPTTEQMDAILRQVEVDALPEHAQRCEFWIAELIEADDLESAERESLNSDAIDEATTIASELTSLHDRFREVALPPLPQVKPSDLTQSFRRLHAHVGALQSVFRDFGKPGLSAKELRIARTIYRHPNQSSVRIAEIMTNKYGDGTNSSAVRRALADKLIHWGFARAARNTLIPPPVESGQAWEQVVVGLDG